MARNKPEIDLSGTQYDPLETSLTQLMGLKTFLIRGWSGSGRFQQASAELQFARTQEAWEAARTKYFSAKEAMLGSLRANIAERDPALAAELSDKDLMSIQQVGHVTLRKSNTEHESAVIIFDPVSTPSTSIAVLGISDGQGGDTTTVNLTTGGSAEMKEPPKEAALRWALSDGFSSLWHKYDDDRSESYVPVANLVENFDIDLDDIRRYQALVNIRYALRNQNEYVDQMSRDLPSFVLFAGLMSEGMRSMGTGYYKKSFREVFEEVSAIEDRYNAIERFGLKDPEFFEKIKLAGAVMNLVYDNLTPNNTFARLKNPYDVTDKVVHDAMEDLKKRMEDNVQQKFPGVFTSGVLDDWRVLFPVFREVYEADQSTGRQREYLDTIMQGLQKWFPTITNAPVPTDLRNNEPPRTLPNSGAARVSPQPGPAPAT